ncbi:hypothetical protein [Nocardioides alkalitolerans]|uniref:hypothetical protein n=1 Tax=Nocardioides alkalitolerans TaxID=281714 RepID=UPI00040A2E81|nr:hypothetical protein [Nocardioides alkalitolerans]
MTGAGYPFDLPMTKTDVRPVSLTKGQGILLTKTELVTASILWPPATDYDVYALVRYADGHVETVSTFGTKDDKRFTTATADGAVRHLGDVGRAAPAAAPAAGKGGGLFGRRKPEAAPAPVVEPAREVIEIRLHPGIRAVVPVAYSAQSNGTGSFRRYAVTMRIDAGGRSVVVEADHANDDDTVFTCVPGIIVNGADETAGQVEVVALEQYSKAGSEKRPALEESLVVTMDAGPVNAFK